MNLKHIYPSWSLYFNHALLSSIIILMALPNYGFSTNKDNPLVLKGLPGITHYNRKDFHADPQFWTVCEDKEGVMYFGNNDGCVIYDGERWYQVNLPNNSSIRSLTTDSAGNVYAGGFNEFGMIKKDNGGQYYYESLLDTLQFKDQHIENLWQVHVFKGRIIYRSFSKLIIIEGNKVTTVPSKQSFVRSFIVNNQYFVQDVGQGIFMLDITKMRFMPYFTPEQYDSEEIIAILPTDNPNQILATTKSGKVFLFELHNQSSRLWTNLFPGTGKDQIECAMQSSDSLYYFGTLSSGIIILDRKGQRYISEENYDRIQDKTVLSLFQNSKGNIWALLNNGLDCINITSPVTTIFDNASLYDVLIDSMRMYLATNQGVFFADNIYEAKPIFTKIDGLEGQGWSLKNIEGDILAGHDKGLFNIKDNGEIEKIGDFSGIWKVVPVSGHPNTYFAAAYAGLYIIKRSPEGKWTSLGKIEGFDESSRDIMETETPGIYWVCHGYKGVFRITIDDELKRVTSLEHFTTQNGLPFPFNINVYTWEGHTVFTTNYGIYTYDQSKNEFVPFERLNNILDPNINTRKILQHEGKTWFIQDDEVGYFITSAHNPRRETDYFLQFKGTFNRGMECIIPLANQQLLLGTKTGLYLFDLNYKKSRRKTSTNITGVSYTSDQVASWLPLASETIPQLPNTTTAIRFEFAAPGMQNDAVIQYAYMLEGLDDRWSAWQYLPFTEFNHLRSGGYTFKVKSRSLLGMTGQEQSYTFEVLPFWYQTWWAWILYAVLLGLFISLMIYLIKRKIRLESSKTREEEQKARRLLELELQQMRLKSEKEKIHQDKTLLEEDIIHKSKELANYTMLLVKKREVMAEIREDLKEMRTAARNEESRRKVREMMAKISHHMTDEVHLQVFEANFEKVHQDFFIQLRTLFPNLTQRELRLCAFVKMNLTNKEISPMLNISVRGVETARYRIRKKLNLEFEHNLVEYLEGLAANTDRRKAHGVL